MRNVLEVLTVGEQGLELRESAVVSMASYVLQANGMDTDPRSTRDDGSFDTALARQRRHNAKFNAVDETTSTVHLILAATKMARKVIARDQASDTVVLEMPPRFLELDDIVQQIIAPLFEAESLES